MKRPLLVLAAAAAGLSFALPAAAQFQKPEDAVKYRKAAFTVMAAHFGRIGAMAQGRVPFDGAAATANAEIVATMSALPFTAFVDGSDKGDTRALPKIWSDRANFDAGAKKMQEEAAKLLAAAKSNNLDNVKTAFGAVGQTCKGCHDNFRKE